MTPERKKALEARCSLMTTLAIREVVQDNSAGRISDAEAAEAISEMAEISACIHAAYRLLSGEVFESLDKHLREMILKGSPTGRAS